MNMASGKNAMDDSRQDAKRVRGAQRTTQEDWMRTALDTLISEGWIR
jgi:hypothetical protein